VFLCNNCNVVNVILSRISWQRVRLDEQMLDTFFRSRFASFEICGLCSSHLRSGSDCKRQEWYFRSLCNSSGG